MFLLLLNEKFYDKNLQETSSDNWENAFPTLEELTIKIKERQINHFSIVSTIEKNIMIKYSEPTSEIRFQVSPNNINWYGWNGLE